MNKYEETKVPFKKGDIVKFNWNWCSEGERKYIFVVMEVNDYTERCIIRCLNSALTLGSSECVSFEMIQLIEKEID